VSYNQPCDDTYGQNHSALGWETTNDTLGALQIIGATGEEDTTPEPRTSLTRGTGLAAFELRYLPSRRKRRLASGDSSCGWRERIRSMVAITTGDMTR